MKMIVILSLGLFSLIFNLTNYNFGEFLKQINFFGFFESSVLKVSNLNNFLMIFDITISIVFLINIYNITNISKMFGV